MQSDLFQQIETKVNLSQPVRFAPNARVDTSSVGRRADSTILSRADLEKELEQVLNQYRSYVAPDQWSRVVAHQPIFIEKATSSQEKVIKVFDRLRKLRISLEKGEKIEAHRARAEVIIQGLEELTAD
jgi:hypothetical protein